MRSRIKVAPSLLAADFSRLDREIKSAESAGADLLHVDVMDGHFVPNITIGPFIVEAIKKVATLALDVHLMISEPERFVRSFADAGADSLDIHIEATGDPRSLIETIQSYGLRAGICMSPETPADPVLGLLDAVDQVTVMTVHPGFGGQKLIPGCVEKVRRVADAAPDMDIVVDGGMNVETVPAVAAAGANVFVAGTAIFGQADRARAIAAIRSSAEAAYRHGTGKAEHA